MLDAKHKSIASKTTSLHDKCKELAETSEKAKSTCAKIAEPLSVYDSYYLIGSAIGLDFADVSAKVVKALGLNNASTGAAAGGGAATAGAAEIVAALKPEVEEQEVDAALAAAIASASAGLLTNSQTNGPVVAATAPTPRQSSTPTLPSSSILTKDFLLQLQQHRSSTRGAKKSAASSGAAIASGPLASPHNAPLLTPSSDPVAFGRCLERVEACIDYLAATTHHNAGSATRSNSATVYIAKYRHLLAFAIQQAKSVLASEVSAVCGRTVKNLKALYAQHHQQLQQQQQHGASGSDSQQQQQRLNKEEVERAEVMLTQVGFKAELPNLRAQVLLIEQRCVARPQAYLASLRETYDVYARERSRVLGELVWHKLQAAVKAHRSNQQRNTNTSSSNKDRTREELHAEELLVVDTIRACCSVVARAAAAESTLFHSLFVAYQPPPTATTTTTGAGGEGQSPSPSPSASPVPYTMPTHVRAAADAAFQSLMDESCGALLIDALRPLLVEMSSLEALCDVVQVLKVEVMAELAMPRGPQLAALGRSAAVLVRDVQERLVFLSQAYIQEVLGNEASAGAAASTASAGAGAGGPSAATASSPSASAYRFIPPSSRLYEPLHVPISSNAVITGILVGGQGVTASALGRNLASSSAPFKPLFGLPFALDYPASLLSYYMRQRSSATAEAPCKPPSMYDAWHPSVELGLLLVSRLSRALEAPSFESLAQEIVRAVTRGLLETHKAIMTRAGTGGGVTPLPSPSSSAAAPSFDGTAGASASGALHAPEHFALHHNSAVSGGAGASAAGGNALTTVAGSHCDDYLASRVKVDAAGPLEPGALSTGLAAAAINPWAPSQQQGTSSSSSAKEGEQCLAVLDGLLFLVKNLLILREQLSPYSFGGTHGGTGPGGAGSGSGAGSGGGSVVTRALDFSSTSESFSSLLRGGRGGGIAGIFRLSLTENALLNFVWSSLPKVSEVRATDCRVELEALLKSACDAFIAVCCNDLLGCGELQRALAATTQDKEAALTACLVDVVRACVAVLPTLRRRVGLYMGSAVTASILFKPVRDAVVRTLKTAVEAEGAAVASAPSLLASLAIRIVEASDQLVVDPSSPMFGMEESVAQGGARSGLAVKLVEGDARAVLALLAGSSAGSFTPADIKALLSGPASASAGEGAGASTAPLS